MEGMLTLEALKKAVAAGEIDTVLVCFPDMQGPLIGKRFHAKFFVDSPDETHGCDYLLANDIDMEPVPGYEASNWARGYGDFIMKPDLATMRVTPWLAGTALVLCDILDHHHDPVPHAPRNMLKKGARPCRKGRHDRVHGERAGILSVRRRLPHAARQKVSRSESRRLLHRGLSHLPDVKGRRCHARDAQRPAGRRHSGGKFQRRMGTGSGRIERALRRSADDGRSPRHHEERDKGDRTSARKAITYMAKWAYDLAGSSCHIHMSLWDKPARLRCSATPRRNTACPTR